MYSTELGINFFGNESNKKRQLKKIETLDKSDNYTILNATIFFKTLIKKEFSQRIRIEKKSENNLYIEILDGHAKDTRVTILTIMQKEKILCYVNSSIKLSLKTVILYPIIKREYNALLTGVFRKISMDAE